MLLISRAEKLVKVEGKKDGAKYSSVLKEKLFQFARDFRLRQNFTFQQDNKTKNTSKSTLE